MKANFDQNRNVIDDDLDDHISYYSAEPEEQIEP